MFSGDCNPLPLPLEDVIPLQLRHSAEDGEHKFPGRGGVDVLLLGDKLHPLCGEQLCQVQQVPGTAGKAADGLHNDRMGRIFRDNGMVPVSPLGLRMDSKRRKKLMAKRLALGHKADDHEEQNWQNGPSM